MDANNSNQNPPDFGQGGTIYQQAPQQEQPQQAPPMQQQSATHISPEPPNPFGASPPAPPQQPSQHTPTTSDPADKAMQFSMFTYFFVAALLLFRFALSLFGASRTTPFVDFVFSLTTPFMLPFEAMFGGPKGYSNYQIEFEVIIALIVYGLIFWGISRLIKIIFK